MSKFFLCCLSFLLISCGLNAQVIPAENDTLNYRFIGFSFPKVKKEKKYIVEIAEGNYTADSVFAQNIIKTVSSEDNRITATVPSFGKSYTWRVNYAGSRGNAGNNGLYHFTVANDAFADTARIKVNVIVKAKKHGDAYFFVDGARALYDMDGRPLWFLPMKEMARGNAQIRDLKISCKNTITFLADGEAFEIDYKGHVLWRGPREQKPKNDTLMGYHHEFTRLRNGHYMMLSFKPFVKPKPQPQPRDSAGHIIKHPDRSNAPKPRYGTIVEYDEAGRQVWNWDAGTYFDTVDLSRYRLASGMRDRDVHENSFFMDEDSKVIYVSFRDMGQVVKVSYPSGKILAAYGALRGPHDRMQDHFFCGEHSVKLSQEGYLYLFNNGCTPTTVPSIVMMKEPETKKDSLTKVWEFPCPVDTSQAQADGQKVFKTMEHSFSAGGNVVELADSSIFVSTNTLYNKLFIVTRSKQIIWEAETQKWRGDKNGWMPFPMYRATIVPDPKQLEDVIWNVKQPAD